MTLDKLRQLEELLGEYVWELEVSPNPDLVKQAYVAIEVKDNVGEWITKAELILNPTKPANKSTYTVKVSPYELRCPVCCVPEVNPKTDKLFIRAYKLDNYSQCLVCSGYYNNAVDAIEQPDKYDPNKGWFK